MTSAPLRKIVILGGGLAGWAAAAGISNSLRGLESSVVLVDPSLADEPSAEYTLPATLKFFECLGIREADLLRETSATYRLGTEFAEWPRRGDRRLLPFGAHGGNIGFIPFHHFATRARLAGQRVDFNAFSMNAAAAVRGRFAHAIPEPHASLPSIEYGLCMDRARCSDLLRRYALASGVREIRSTVDGVFRRNDDGFLEALLLPGGATIDGDLFIDCSGDQALLAGETLGVAYEDWSAVLPCDRMLSFVTRPHALPATLLRCAAADYGWMLRVPLRGQNPTGSMLFASRILNEDAAVARVLAADSAAAVPVLTRFRNGHRTRFWDRNCIALGSAAGSMEPLVFSELHLVQSGVMRLVRMFPDTACDPRLAGEYNKETREEYENARDFLRVIYAPLVQRDSPFRQAAGSELPGASFRRRHDLFRSSGGIVSLEHETFPAAAWVAAWISAGVWPEGYHPLLNRMDAGELTAHFSKMSAAIEAAAGQLPLHDAYIDDLLRRSPGEYDRA